jgi:hypothetical protein
MGDYANECTEPKKKKDSGSAEGTANVIIGADSDESDGLDEFMFVNKAEEEDSDGISNHYDHMCDAVDFEGFTFHQATKCVNPKWILLDSQSTTDIFNNVYFLSNIHKSGRSLTTHCNAGIRRVTLVGTLRNYGKVWYCKDAIANIISLAKVKERYPVKYDSKQGN